MNISDILWLIPSLPLLGFLILAFFGKKIATKIIEKEEYPF